MDTNNFRTQNQQVQTAEYGVLNFIRLQAEA